MPCLHFNEPRCHLFISLSHSVPSLHSLNHSMPYLHSLSHTGLTLQFRELFSAIIIFHHTTQSHHYCLENHSVPSLHFIEPHSAILTMHGATQVSSLKIPYTCKLIFEELQCHLYTSLFTMPCLHFIEPLNA